MPPVPPPQVGDTARLGLARLALDVVSTIPGVAGTDAGPNGLCVTADPPAGVLRGVSVIAQPDGRYEVDMCLVARMVPLLPLGEEIRRRLRARAARAGLGGQLGTVNVEFSGALSEGETMLEEPSGEAAFGGAAQVTAPALPSQPPVLPGSPPPDPPVVPEGPPPGPVGSPAPPPGPPAVPEGPLPGPVGSPAPPPGATGSTHANSPDPEAGP